MTKIVNADCPDRARKTTPSAKATGHAPSFYRDPLFLTERQVAARWGVGASTVRRLRLDGRIPYFTPTPGRVLYRLSDVTAYEIDHTHDPRRPRAVAR